MPEFVKVAKLSQIPPGTARECSVNGREVAVFNIAGVPHAVDAYCPHQGGPLADGYIEGTVVTCPWHAWCFDVTTGKMTIGDLQLIDTFDARVEGDDICVSDEPRARRE